MGDSDLVSDFKRERFTLLDWRVFLKHRWGRFGGLRAKYASSLTSSSFSGFTEAGALPGWACHWPSPVKCACTCVFERVWNNDRASFSGFEYTSLQSGLWFRSGHKIVWSDVHLNTFWNSSCKTQNLCRFWRFWRPWTVCRLLRRLWILAFLSCKGLTHKKRETMSTMSSRNLIPSLSLDRFWTSARSASHW